MQGRLPTTDLDRRNPLRHLGVAQVTHDGQQGVLGRLADVGVTILQAGVEGRATGVQFEQAGRGQSFAVEEHGFQ